MIRASCHKCNTVAHYFPPITLEQIKQCPPFHGQPIADGDCNHEWIIKEIKIGR